MNPRKYPRKTCPGCGRDEVAYSPETGAMVFHKCYGGPGVKVSTSDMEQPPERIAVVCLGVSRRFYQTMKEFLDDHPEVLE